MLIFALCFHGTLIDVKPLGPPKDPGLYFFPYIWFMYQFEVVTGVDAAALQVALDAWIAANPDAERIMIAMANSIVWAVTIHWWVDA